MPSEGLAGVVGRRIKAIRRMFYVHGVDVDRTEGPIELTFDDGSVLLLDAGTDGEELRVGSTRWHDPFAGVSEPEYIEYVAESGKYTAFDVGSEPPYSHLLGCRIAAITESRLHDDRLRAATLEVNGSRLAVETIADELLVRWHPEA
ncbi:hypothetical protein OG874_38805 [Nocardia sp. NBC_00565]|uniref:hypothetical protein n=1 Tax=Nocardia sp. NBC_00565 TaxID=2975993 RepID=UPI002E8218BE|nr:hypothetical protein [Nocardia sp. NBC_00565]WUC02598.1 hypothetical protein OG874_38805 [Nocardia sp. NBC_00565]